MLPNLALITATAGLLSIMGLIYREVGPELGSTERASFAGGALVILVVAVWHLLSTAGGAAHYGPPPPFFFSSLAASSRAFCSCWSTPRSVSASRWASVSRISRLASGVSTSGPPPAPRSARSWPQPTRLASASAPPTTTIRRTLRMTISSGREANACPQAPGKKGAERRLFALTPWGD